MWPNENSLFRENPKYYGDLNCDIHNAAMSVSSKYVAFCQEKHRISFLPTDFSAAQKKMSSSAKRAEYGSQDYTTKNVPVLAVLPASSDPSDPSDSSDSSADAEHVNCLLFNKFNASELFSCHESGQMNCWQLPQTTAPLYSVNVSSAAKQLCQHPTCAESLVIGTNNSVCLADVSNASSTQIVNEFKLNDCGAVCGLSYLNDGSTVYCITNDSQLLYFDPRIAQPQQSMNENVINNSIACIPNKIAAVDENRLIIAGLTGFKEPVVYIYDRRKIGKFVCKANYSYKNCKPLLCYDPLISTIYLSFERSNDLLCISLLNGEEMDKASKYQCVDDSFISFDMMPKYCSSKREINKFFKLGFKRDTNSNANNANTNNAKPGLLQCLTHVNSTKLIYHSIANASVFCTPLLSFADYYGEKQNAAWKGKELCSLVSVGFEETRQRTTSLFQHIYGDEPNANHDKFFGYSFAKSCKIASGNAKCNQRYVVFPGQVTGGGALSIIPTAKLGRIKQIDLRGHSEEITSFDVCKFAGFEHALITGSSDCKAILWRIDADSLKASPTFTFKHQGKVSFVCFHPRIKSCVVSAARTINGCSVFFWETKNDGRLIREIECCSGVNKISTVRLEPIYGLLMAVALKDGVTKIFDIQNGNCLLAFKSLCTMREADLFWVRDPTDNSRYMTKLLAIGFATGSVRKFGVYNVGKVVARYYENILHDTGNNNGEDNGEEKAEAENEAENTGTTATKVVTLKCMSSKSFGVSNAIPIAYYDIDSCLFFVSEVNGRTIRVFEIHNMNADTNFCMIREMTKAIHSGDGILGLAFHLKQFVDVRSVEIARCFKFCGSTTALVKLKLPRRRLDFFQDDIYTRDTVDTYSTESLSVTDFVRFCSELNFVPEFAVQYVSMRPPAMELLSEAPEQEMTVQQQKRKIMTVKQQKEEPKNVIQAFEQFNRTTTDTATQNRWDATPIEMDDVDEDEWSD